MAANFKLINTCIVRIVVSHVHYFALVNTEFHLPFYCPLLLQLFKLSLRSDYPEQLWSICK